MHVYMSLRRGSVSLPDRSVALFHPQRARSACLFPVRCLCRSVVGSRGHLLSPATAELSLASSLCFIRKQRRPRLINLARTGQGSCRIAQVLISSCGPRAASTQSPNLLRVPSSTLLRRSTVSLSLSLSLSLCICVCCTPLSLPSFFDHFESLAGNAIVNLQFTAESFF